MLLEHAGRRSAQGYPYLENQSGYRVEQQGQTLRVWGARGNELLRAEGPKPDLRIRVSRDLQSQEQQKLEQLGNQAERDLQPKQQQSRSARRR